MGVRLPHHAAAETEDHLAELSLLTDTAGGCVVGTVTQERPRFDPAYLVGKGKAGQIAEAARIAGVQTVIFDDELSPAQIRNLEEVIDAKVLDRGAVILDIFARRARSREARTQVELAQLEYLLPRLTRRWTHLSRQAGGTIGLKGVGETQLEVDRRIIRRRIGRLKQELSKVERARRERRRGRSESFKAALIGYTNAGKSTLFNVLCGGGDAFVENRLFATLDPLVRRCRTRDGECLVIDTVGFIRKLPHHLVASFRSTLEEAAVADLLLHVVDVSHAEYEEQMVVTNAVLKDMGLQERPTLLVFNKTDHLSPEALEQAVALHPEALAVSAREGAGVSALRDAIGDAMRRSRQRISMDSRDGAREAVS